MYSPYPIKSLASSCPALGLIFPVDASLNLIFFPQQLFQSHPSFIPAISIAPLQVLYYSGALLTTARILYRSFTPKRHRQLQVKDLPKVPTWQLERESSFEPLASHLAVQHATAIGHRAPHSEALS